jgi:hypothetical protein
VIDLPDPHDLLELPVEQLPAVLVQLAALQAAVAARLVASDRRGGHHAREHDDGADVVLDVHEAARVARRSVSWMRKHGRTVPGFVQQTGHGGRVGWSRRALAEWATGGRRAC